MKRRGGWGMSGWMLFGSGVVGAGLCALIYHFSTQSALLAEEFRTASDNLEAMKRFRTSYRQLESRKQKMPAGNQVNPNEYEAFLSQKAFVGAQLPKENFRIAAPREPKVSGGWKEYAYLMTLTAAPNQPISRKKAIQFLDLVETEAPTFKSKDLTLRFSGEPNRNDLSSMSVVFSHFTR